MVSTTLNLRLPSRPRTLRYPLACNHFIQCSALEADQAWVACYIWWRFGIGPSVNDQCGKELGGPLHPKVNIDDKIGGGVEYMN